MMPKVMMLVVLDLLVVDDENGLPKIVKTVQV